MKFRSNPRLALYLTDLKKAEAFYTGVLGFRLLSRSSSQLEYDTGRLTLSIARAAAPRAPTPSFTVISARDARHYLEQHGCEIVEDRGSSLCVRDPFGLVYEITED